jgi:hypothetical protein
MQKPTGHIAKKRDRETCFHAGTVVSYVENHYWAQTDQDCS